MSNQKTVKETTKKDTEKIKRYGKISKTVKHTSKNQTKSKKQTAFHYHKKQQKSVQENFESPVKIAFLGGLNEVGKNLTVIEYNNAAKALMELGGIECPQAMGYYEMLVSGATLGQIRRKAELDRHAGLKDIV